MQFWSNSCNIYQEEGEELVLTHHGVTIRVKVTDIKGGQVKVGVEAPREVEIIRRELQKSDRSSLVKTC